MTKISTYWQIPHTIPYTCYVLLALVVCQARSNRPNTIHYCRILMFHLFPYFQLCAITTANHSIQIIPSLLFYQNFLTMRYSKFTFAFIAAAVELVRLLNDVTLPHASIPRRFQIVLSSSSLSVIAISYLVRQVCAKVLTDSNNVRLRDISRQNASPIRFLGRKDKKKNIFGGWKRKKGKGREQGV